MSQLADARPRLLNLGCGADYREDWHNVDISPAVDPDETVDLDATPWPFPSDHFVRIHAHHVLEHLADPIAALHELARVLAPDGRLTITYPLGHTRFEDPTHEQYWGYHTAAVLAGERAHSHEVDVPLAVTRRDVTWSIGQADPLLRWYTHLRARLYGEGPWLEQIPGVSGEVTATYELQP